MLNRLTDCQLSHYRTFRTRNLTSNQPASRSMKATIGGQVDDTFVLCCRLLQKRDELAAPADAKPAIDDTEMISDRVLGNPYACCDLSVGQT